LPRIRVLVLSNMYPPHHLGGYELSCRDVVERLRARGHEVTVLTTTMRVPGVSDPPGEHASGVRRELQMYLRDGELWSPPLRRRLRVERENHAALERAVREVRPDVVSVWHMGAMSLGLLTSLAERDIPLVYAVCDDWLIYGPDLDRWSRLFLRRRARLPARLVRAATGVPTLLPDLGRTGSFLFVSDVTRRAAAAWSRWRYPDSTVVFSGIDTGDFPLAEPDERPWRWRLLFVGRIDERKGIYTTLDALSRLPSEATLTIVGRASERERARLDAAVADRNLSGRVTVTEGDRSELRRHYLDADAVVFASEWEEPFGLVPVEAMACATPVAATGVGGSGAFLVDGVNCVRFEPGDAAALAAAVERLAGDPALRRRLVDGGLHTARDLDVDHLADVFDAWHHAAATRFRDGRPPDRPPPGPPRR
jgi:glycosyltransferase involved in cell wall biosynthesis